VKNVVWTGVRQEQIVYERLRAAIMETANGMGLAQVVGLLEMLKLELIEEYGRDD